jgi:hypothetical protein
MGIKPALSILDALDNRMFLDKLAVSLHTATGDVIALGKPAKIVITLTLDMFSAKGLAEPVITVQASIDEKFPKPDQNVALFYCDGDGNLTVNQQRQRDLNLSIADVQPREEQHGR